MKVLEGFKKVMEFIVVIIMMAMVVVIFLATFGRYTGVFSIPWSEEFARYCMVSMVYLASMLAAAKGAHFCVEIADVILLNRFLAEDTAVTVTDQGIANADCVYDGETAPEDSTAILQYLAGLIPYSDLGNQ